MRILIAEDQKDLNKILTKKLSAEGYSVDSCFDGQEALDCMRVADYDGVILDVNMPRLDGFGVVKAMRADGMPGAGALSDCQRQHRGQGDGAGPGCQ